MATVTCRSHRPRFAVRQKANVIPIQYPYFPCSLVNFPQNVKLTSGIVRVPRKLGGEKGTRQEENEKKEQAIKSMDNPKRK